MAFPRIFLFSVDITMTLFRAESRVLRLDNDNPIHLVLASGKLVLQKRSLMNGKKLGVLNSLHPISILCQDPPVGSVTLFMRSDFLFKLFFKLDLPVELAD